MMSWCINIVMISLCIVWVHSGVLPVCWLPLHLGEEDYTRQSGYITSEGLYSWQLGYIARLTVPLSDVWGQHNHLTQDITRRSSVWLERSFDLLFVMCCPCVCRWSERAVWYNIRPWTVIGGDMVPLWRHGALYMKRLHCPLLIYGQHHATLVHGYRRHFHSLSYNQKLAVSVQ